MPPATATPPVCVCQQPADQPLDETEIYWRIYDCICKDCKKVPVKTQKMFRAVQGALYPEADAGDARVGKSTDRNATVRAGLYFVPMNKRPAKVDEFKESNLAEPMTKWIQVMAVPRYFDTNLKQTQEQNGTMLIFDSEGMSLGDTSMHHVIPMIILPAVTCVKHFQGGSFNFKHLNGVADLGTKGLFGADSNQSPRASRPVFGFVLNKATVDLPTGVTPKTFWERHLEDSLTDVGNNLNRQFLRGIVGTTYLTAYIKESPKLTDDQLRATAQLLGITFPTNAEFNKYKAEAISKMQAPMENAFKELALETFRKTLPLTAQYAAGTGPPGEGKRLNGSEYCDFFVALVSRCIQSKDKFDQPSVTAAFRDGRLTTLKDEALVRYEREVKGSESLRVGCDKYDGGRKLADEQVESIKNDLEQEHDRLVNVCLDWFTEGAKMLSAMDPDGIYIGKSKEVVKSTLKKEQWESKHLNHFVHMRLFKNEKQENRTVVTTRYVTVTHAERFLGIRVGHSSSTYPVQDTKTETRFIKTRYNGDEVVTPWT